MPVILKYIHSDETPETVLVYVGNGCVCIRILCDSIFTDITIVETNNHSNICNCPGFGWDGVNLLPSSRYNAVFSI